VVENMWARVREIKVVWPISPLATGLLRAPSGDEDEDGHRGWRKRQKLVTSALESGGVLDSIE
jgi:hypothetical protein